MKNRVVITGLGLVTPLGIGVADFWSACREGRSGVRPTRLAEAAAGAGIPIAGIVSDFNPADFVPKAKFGRMDRFSQFALVATKLALEDARLDLRRENPRKIGVLLGSSLGGMDVAEEQTAALYSRGPKRIHPKLVPAYTLNAAAGEVAIAYGLRGPNLSVSTPYVSGAVALGLAYDAFQLYDIDIVFAGGVDAPLGHLTSKSLARTGLLSSKVMRPFDRNRDGFVLGEGCAVLVLERLEHVLERGASIYAEYAGYGQTHSGHSLDVEAVKIAGERALEIGSVSREEVDYVHAHGAATREGDLLETQSIKALLGPHAYDIPVSSTKAMIGNTLGAAGAIELAVCALSTRDGVVPPTINHEHPDPECDLDYVAKVARRSELGIVLSYVLGLKGDNLITMLRRVD